MPARSLAASTASYWDPNLRASSLCQVGLLMGTLCSWGDNKFFSVRPDSLPRIPDWLNLASNR
jgi:hypothetical protein